MKASRALPPARNCDAVSASNVFGVVGVMVLAVCLPWLTGCAGLSSGNSGNNNGPLIVTGTLPAAQAGVAYNAVLSVSGGKAPYTFSVLSGALPAGLSLGQSSGSISGTPTQSGAFNFSVQATDSAGIKGSNTFSLTVSSAGSINVTVSPATVTIASSATEQFTAVVSNTSNVAVTWSATTGTISSSGLYTAPKVSVNSTATVTATSKADPTKSGKASLTITAGSTSLSITTSSLPAATASTAYSDTLQASGGTAPYKWAISSGILPTGLSLQSSGSLSGTTSQTGQFTLTIQASDSSSPPQTASKAFTLTVNSKITGPTISKSFFAADFNKATGWPPTDGLNQSATLSGIRLWDDGVKWGQINTANGVYDFTALDTFLGNAQSVGMDVLYTFGDTPQFAAITTPPGTCLQAGPYSCAPPIDVNADGTGTDAYFQAFVTALVTHAAGRINYYELWNEPDCTCFWSGNTAQLVRMSKDAATIIRSLDPNAKILSPSAHGPSMATWFDGYIAAGGAADFDIVNVHMRGQGSANVNPESFLTVWGQVQTELQARNLTSLPVWDDEHGILQGQMTDPDMLAGYVAREAILRAGVGVQRQYVYMWDSVAPYGLQGNGSGTAWDQVAGWLIGHSMSACTASGTVYTCQLDSGEIVWDTAQSCSGGVCTTSNYTYPTKYVWYKDMMSSSQFALSGSTVQIGYKPILLTNQ
ncbi:MAG TPA: putative Ig domain-containing protein [Candidatus Dormibacteraeota bacterium]|nr:putative Ig domain-containing protein [Candidatus Dormibacteraeota bacterium]